MRPLGLGGVAEYSAYIRVTYPAYYWTGVLANYECHKCFVGMVLCVLFVSDALMDGRRINWVMGAEIGVTEAEHVRANNFC